MTTQAKGGVCRDCGTSPTRTPMSTRCQACYREWQRAINLKQRPRVPITPSAVEATT